MLQVEQEIIRDYLGNILLRVIISDTDDPAYNVSLRLDSYQARDIAQKLLESVEKMKEFGE